MWMFQVTASHFCAGGIVENGVITKMAPILAYMRSMSPREARAYCSRKGWKFTYWKTEV